MKTKTHIVNINFRYQGQTSPVYTLAFEVGENGKLVSLTVPRDSEVSLGAGVLEAMSTADYKTKYSVKS